MADRREGNGDQQHPFGPGSHRPLSDISEMPECYPIKGTTDAGDRSVYHRPDSGEYEEARAEVWFDSPMMAEAAGFELSSLHPEGSSGESFEPGADGHPCTGQQVELNRLTARGLTISPPAAEAAGSAGADDGTVGSADAEDGAGDTDGEEAQPGQLAADPDRHPYGVGSHMPLSDVSETPRFHPVKGRVDSDGARRYHRPDSSEYRATEASVWFDSPSAAEAAGFELGSTHPAGSSGADYEPGGSDHGWTLAEVRAARRNALTGERGVVPPAARLTRRSDTADGDADADGGAVAPSSGGAVLGAAGAGLAAGAGIAFGGAGVDTDPEDDLEDGGDAPADGAPGPATGAEVDAEQGGSEEATAGPELDDGQAAGDDDTVGLGKGAAAGAGAAAAGAGAATLAGRDATPGLPDLEEAATEVAQGRIVGEYGEQPAGGTGSGEVEGDVGAGDPELTAPSPAGSGAAGEGSGEVTGPSPAGTIESGERDAGAEVTASSPAAGNERSSGSAGRRSDDVGEQVEVTSPAPAGLAGVGAAAMAGAGRTDGGPGETVKVADGGPTRPASTTGDVRSSSVSRSTTDERGGIARLIGAVAGSVALVALLAFLLSQCGGADTAGTTDDGSTTEGSASDAAATGDDASSGAGSRAAGDAATTGNDDDANPAAGGGSDGDADTDWTATGGSNTDAGGSDDPASPVAGADGEAESDAPGEAERAVAGSGASGSEDDTDAAGRADAVGESSGAGTTSDAELQALALATLEGAGLGELQVEIEDGVIRLVGDVESQADADAAVAVIVDMEGMEDGMAVESALVVAVDDDDTSGPEPVEDEPPLTG